MYKLNFNPHEREARDGAIAAPFASASILIHTSVKLVTRKLKTVLHCSYILIHTSVKLVTSNANGRYIKYAILIHTSVKLVTDKGLGSRFV